MCQCTFYSMDIWLFFYLYLLRVGLNMNGLFQELLAAYAHTSTVQERAARYTYSTCHQPCGTIVSAMLMVPHEQLLRKGRGGGGCLKSPKTLAPCIRTGTPVIFHAAVAVRWMSVQVDTTCLIFPVSIFQNCNRFFQTLLLLAHLSLFYSWQAITHLPLWSCLSE